MFNLNSYYEIGILFKTIEENKNKKHFMLFLLWAMIFNFDIKITMFKFVSKSIKAKS